MITLSKLQLRAVPKLLTFPVGLLPFSPSCRQLEILFTLEILKGLINDRIHIQKPSSAITIFIVTTDKFHLVGIPSNWSFLHHVSFLAGSNLYYSTL